MTVVSVTPLHAVDAEKRSNYLRKVVRYRIVCNSELDGPDVITAAAPQVDSSTYINPWKYGNDNDNSNLVCRSVSNLKKENTRGIWNLDAEFIYERDLNPETRGVKVTPLTRTETEVSEFGEFIGWYKSKNATITHEENLEVDTDIDDVDVKALDIGKVGPITNSAGLFHIFAIFTSARRPFSR
jgi:hypothetical protein